MNEGGGRKGGGGGICRIGDPGLSILVGDGAKIPDVFGASPSVVVCGKPVGEGFRFTY